jgi:uncharacterized hydrophobic protein (TIGR00341 family)
LEKLEVIAYPYQSDEIEKILSHFQVPFIRTDGESNRKRYLMYIITVPEGIVGILIETLEEKLDNSEKNIVINHYKTDSTISDYLENYQAFIDDGNITNTSNNNNNLKNKINHQSDRKIENTKRNGLNLDYTIVNNGDNINPIKENSSKKNNTSHENFFNLTLDSSIKEKIKKNKINSKKPIEELISKTDSFFSKKNDVYLMVLLATTISLVGLITDSVAVIIGSMLISPLIGPISSIALNTALGRRKETAKSVRFLLIMIGSSILLSSAIAFGLSLVMEIKNTDEIQSRTSARALWILVALILGVSGGLSLLTSIREIIAGVAIAVALIPPATVVGIGIGTGSTDVAFNSFLVLASNIVGLITGFIVVFLIKEIKPRKFQEQWEAKRIVKRNMVILIALASALGFIIRYFP